MFPNPYIADCDNNLSGAVRYFRERGNRDFRYDIINMNDDNTMVPPEKRWDRLWTCCRDAALDPWVKTIIVDSATAASVYLVDHILANKSDGKDKDKMTIADWIPFRNMISKFITTFRTVGKFFIMTCHEIADKNDLTGEIRYVPSIPSNLKDHFGGFFSDEWLAVTEDKAGTVQRFVKTVAEPRRSMGTSLDLPSAFEFNWEKFEARLNKFNEVMKGK
jgi:hypothetical protein